MWAVTGIVLFLGYVFFNWLDKPRRDELHRMMTYEPSQEEKDINGACFWFAKYSNRIDELSACKSMRERMEKFLPHMETKESEERMMRCYRAAAEQGRSDEFRWAMSLEEMEEKFLK